MTPSYSINCHYYWTFGNGYEEYVIKVFYYVKWICGAKNHSLFNVTPIYPIFYTHKNSFYWLLQPVQIWFRRKKFLIKLAFPYLWFCVELSKCLCKVCPNKGILRCKILILTPVHEDMYFCRISRRLVRPNIHFLVSAVAQLDQIVFMVFLSHCNSAHELTCLHRRFLSSIAALYRPTHPQGHFFPLT